MSASYISLPVLAILSRVVKACDIDMPNIIMSVQFAGRGVLGSQQSTEFMVPLYSDCNYISQGAPVQAGSTVPSTAVAANFPGDSFGFTGSDGLSLDSGALDNFLQILGTSIGRSINANTALGLVVCTVGGSDGTTFSFDDTKTYMFDGGAPIDVASYQCAVVVGA